MGLRQNHIVAQHKSYDSIHFVVEIKLLEVAVLREKMVHSEGVLSLRFDSFCHFAFLLVDLEHCPGGVPNLILTQCIRYECITLVLDLLRVLSRIKSLSSHSSYIHTLTPIWISVWRFRKSEIEHRTAANAVGPGETGEPVEHKP